MIAFPYIAGPHEAAAAADLIDTFGSEAGREAADRASRSRDLGNHIQFCRWRQIGRLVELLAGGRGAGTLH